MDRDFQELEDKENAIREMSKKCFSKCEAKLERDRKRAGDDMEALEAVIQANNKAWDQCKAVLKKDLKAHRRYAQKRRCEILEQCISTERSSRR